MILPLGLSFDAVEYPFWERFFSVSRVVVTVFRVPSVLIPVTAGHVNNTPLSSDPACTANTLPFADSVH